MMKRTVRTLLIFILVAFLITASPFRSPRSVAFLHNREPQVSEFLVSQNPSHTVEEDIQEGQGQAAEPQPPQDVTNVEEGFPVVLDGETVFQVLVGGRTTSARQRAEIASEELEEIAQDFSISVDAFTLEDFGEVILIVAEEERLIFGVTNDDAVASNRDLQELAEEHLQAIKENVTLYRQERSTEKLLSSLVYLAISTAILFLILAALKFIFPIVFRRIEASRDRWFRPIRVQNLQLISAESEAAALIFAIRLVRWAIVLSLLYIYIPFALSLFTQTERIGKYLLNTIYVVLELILDSFVGFIPNLFAIAIIAVSAYYLIQFCRLLFNAIDSRRIRIPGFYEEWSEPTYKLTILFIIAIAAVLAFPYIPGFDSPSFRGLSLLFGAVITLGGASAVSNVIGGYIIIYTRGFQLGDRVKLGEYVGVVLEKTVLSTRIRTPQNEIITIPNSTMLTSSIVNYTATLRDVEEPLILNTTITLGYDVPWRKVHQILIDAAHATSEIVDKPAPFVLQTSLDDFYVSYELRAYTNNTTQIIRVYSELHQNIQDKCNEADIEIMSPHYSAMRDGHQITIPENYLPGNYVPPAFRVAPLDPTIAKPQEATGESVEPEDSDGNSG
ncbi:MAG: mechanosensitive ion channel family protein [Synechococcus sp.]